MRKHQQQQIFELLHTLDEAHDELARQTETHTVVSLLADCQEFAMKIGEYIESIEGEETRTVTHLEEYCELLYKASVRFEPANSIAELRRKLIVIKNSVSDELKPNKIEIAFFPYKASMFDALESIWLAAKDDPRCDVYVVPIPYYDKMPNGQLGQMHDESDQYPAHIPITNWREYDVEMRRPDIIFIHNPYDNNNIVTSVHPLYYSKRLRDLTDQLVYVPYFVSAGDVSENSCSLPGCIYAHKVFVQSEKVRQTYISVYKRLAQQHNFGDAFGIAEEKFQALGSPKFDKVVNSKRADYPLPDEWVAKMIRPDGTRKKVVLYNTAITSLLTGNDAVLHKLKYVFDIFRERDNVLLWWRPHPLNGTVYSSMRPQLLAEYEAIVAEYQRSGIGIYDDSADSQRAIAFSDAYYGDGGSLMALYSLTGKSMMRQDVEQNGRTTLNPYAITHTADDGSQLWWSVQSGNALLCMNKATKATTFVASFPGERYSGWPLYASAILCDHRLFFVPGSANALAVYDTSTGAWEKISFELNTPDTGQDYYPNTKFVEIKRYNNGLYLIPFSYPAIIRYDLDTGKVDYLNDWVQLLKPYIFDTTEAWFTHVAQEGSRLLLPACNANAVVIFDMETRKSTVQFIECGKRGFSGICYDGEQYWLTPRKHGGVTRWSRRNNSFVELAGFPEGFNGGVYPFIPPIYANRSIWLLPNQANMVIKFEVGDQKMARVGAFPAILGPFTYAQLLDDKLVAVSSRENRLVEWDVRESSVTVSEIIVSGEDQARMSRQGIFSDYNNEASATGLDRFCDYLNERNHIPAGEHRLRNQIGATIANSDGSAGQAIFKNCMQALRLTPNVVNAG